MKKMVLTVTEKIATKIRELTIGDDAKHRERHEIMLKQNTTYTFGDQKGQVGFLVNSVLNYEKNGLKRGGYFVDLACADGVHINNTYFLERHLGWKGILFEPNPVYQSIIRSKRSSVHVSECVTDKVGDTVRFRVDNGMLGGIVSDDTDNNEKTRGHELSIAEIISVKTTTLENELEKHGAPTVIDFLSLDVEGAEYLVLKSFPFEKYKFRCMAIERPNEKLDLLLDSKGYVQVKHLSYDVIYVHRDFFKDVNFSPNAHFMFTPKKNW